MSKVCIEKTLAETQSVEELLSSFNEIVHLTNPELVNENANLNASTPMGQMGKFASESARFFARENLLSEEVKKAIEANLLYPHDLDFMPTGTTTCCQIPLGQMLTKGFDTGHGSMRPPKDISSAMALASIILQANQNMQHGGQSFPMFDADLAPFVRKTYEKHVKRLEAYPSDWSKETIEQIAWEETENTVYQACEAFVHNCNSMHSRGGGQVPFVSVNYGTDTTKEGRMLIKNLLLATKAGLGNGETPIFPIQIFKVKEGVNFNENDPNYDLYLLALETTAERLFPNFSFIDSPFNKQYYDGTHESEVAYMGCRTRVMGNRHGVENSIGRGNLSFTSINLVKLALLSNTLEDFYRRLDDMCDLAIVQLYERYLYQAAKQVRHFPFLYTQGVWKGAEELNEDDQLKEILKQGSLAFGFIGLAECVKALTGFHHGESEESYELALDIIRFMREKADKAAETYDLNYSLIATPAEGLSGKFVKKDRLEFGSIKDITDREYYTNSFHIPVHFPIKSLDKIRKEAPFHAYCNGGHITYVEIDGDPKNNLKALDQIIRAMAHYKIGYGSINHPVDRCLKCNYKGYIQDTCPHCGNENEEDIERIRRITGYLVGDMSKWNPAKRAEERNRVKHG